ncbi:MAG TPA: DNA polymerase I [Oscillospiraceae bacterium]|nr:DNA polymerase I [Oscillospiraceae bacterium]
MKLMILDGNSIVNRAFYGVRMLTAPDGAPTNGVYGFVAILQKLLDEQRPDSVCVAFDVHAPTFRHEAFADYKAQRRPMPDDLVKQMPVLKDVLDAMGIRRYECAGWEADDILGTAGKKCEDAGWDCLIVTGDKDSFQLITDTTHVFHVKSRMGQTETQEYTPEVFRAEYGFDPAHIVDLKALMGDPSDNIPGVPGVGEKTAMDLIQRYTTIERIYDGLDTLDVRDVVRKKLAEGRDSAFQSYRLATISREAPVDFAPEANLWQRTASPALYELFHRLGFNKFIDKWGLTAGAEAAAAAKSAALPETDVTAETLPQFCAALAAADYAAVLPADGLDGLEVCDGRQVWRLNWSAVGEGYNDLLRALFSPEVKKVSQNIKDLMNLLLAEKLPAEGFVFDTALAAYLLESTESDYSPQRLSVRYLGEEKHGAEALWRLYPVLDKAIRDGGMRKLLYDIELPLCRVLADMERVGFLVDKKALFDYGAGMTGTIDALQKTIWARAGREFNINSPKQLGEVLYDDLQLPSGKKTKTGWSTNADVLEKLQGKHPIIRDILDYRTLTKLKSTYADGLLKVISPDGRIHTSFQMTVTATGRLSSTEPNLQNIPVRSELGGEIRKMFTAGPGNLLVDADYSQIELRLLAHISGDKAMREAFLSGMDFHTVTASQVFGVPVEAVTPLLRGRAKAVNFGIVYGISPWSLGNDIGVSTAEAKAYMDAYYEKYSGVRAYMDGIIEKAKRDGYVETLYGRRRSLPELKSSNFAQRSFGERVALNMPIQGTAADIIKLAMVNVAARLRREGLAAQLILQVHDELIVECPADEAETVKKLLEEEMENVVHLAVPLPAEAKSGVTWAQAH